MMKHLSVLQFVSYALFLALLLASPAIPAAASSAMRADLTHVDSGRGFTKWELLSRMASRSRARGARFRPRDGRGGGCGAHPATAPVAPGTIDELETEYLIHLSIGTPHAQHVALTMDTGSDLIWTQCAPCPLCFDQPLPLYTPSESKTFTGLPCSDPLCGGFMVSACYITDRGCFYLYMYADKSISAGPVLRDTFTFKAPDGKGATVVVPNLAFGCGHFDTGVYKDNESGIAGFGRGPQSLPSQLKVARFSHCFTSIFGSSGKSSPMFLGTPDDLRAHATGPIQSTPFVRNPKNAYYLSFKGITVGKTRLPIDESVFALKGDGSGGTIIDSGTGTTSFPQAVYEHLRSAFVSQIHLHVFNASELGLGSMLCFSLPKGAAKVPVPNLVFHLAGADMELPRDNYMVDSDEDGLMCLNIIESEDDTTLIGNFQQQNMHIVYDVGNEKLLFAPAQCDKM